MTAENLHTVLLASLCGYVVNGFTAKHAVTAAKLKMQSGIAVGGCLEFTTKNGYVDTYLRDKENGQTLGTAVRYFYRLLDGVGVDTKYDSSEEKKKRKEIKAAEEAEAAKRKKEKEEKEAEAAAKQKRAAEIKEESDRFHRERYEKQMKQNAATETDTDKHSAVTVVNESSAVKDLKAIHAKEKAQADGKLEAADKRFNNLLRNYFKLSEEAQHLAKLGTQAADGNEKILTAIVKVSKKFLESHESKKLSAEDKALFAEAHAA